ncbi:uncharacterized protein LOC121507394 [Cheilinus undulatus]|uniref:uncharacterized protein LOC121507394 n=1 Tax=Cheilinus undulatus TaxID=241271 RepID=UPI001BD326B9|nr:uncharacterized protein LOC121507394 [Cheilinus undulatus]
MENNDPTTILNGTFYFKTLPDGSIDRSKAICSFCQTEFKYHRSNSSLIYHLRAKHTDVANQTCVNGRQQQQRQQSSILEYGNRHRPVDEIQSDRLTTALAIWVATDRRPVDIVEDPGLRDVLRLACCDQSYVLPSRGTVVSRIQELYETEKATRLELLKGANTVPSSGDQWTSGAESIEDLEVRVKDEKELQCPLPIISTSFSLMGPRENSQQEMELPLKRKISSAETLTNSRDDDELFLLSLLPSLKRLTIKKRMAVRLKFQQALYDTEFED